MPYPHGGAVEIFRDLEGAEVHNPSPAQIRDWGDALETKADANADALALLTSLNASGAPMFEDIAAGIAGTSDGDYFNIPSAELSESILLYENDNGTAVLTARYPSAEAVLTPAKSGARFGWADPYFRNLEIGSSLFGRNVWYRQSDSYDYKFSLTENPVFQGKALRKTEVGTGSDFLAGLKIRISDLGADVGDTITVRALFVGDGAFVHLCFSAIECCGFCHRQPSKCGR